MVFKANENWNKQLNHPIGYNQPSTFGAAVDPNVQHSEGVENIPVRQTIGFSRSRDSGRGSYSVTHHSKSGG